MKNSMTKVNKNVLLDTNIILRYLLDDHPNLSVEASKIFDKIKTGLLKAHVAKYVIIEIVFVLSKIYLIPRKEIVETISDLLKLKYIFVDNREIIYKALDIYDINNISIVDAMLACDARNLNFDLLTFDKKLSAILK